MAAKISYFKIGLFVTIAVGLAVAGVIVLGAAALFQESYDIVTYLSESVQGLAVGAPLKVRGVPIGHVAEIELAGFKYDLRGATLSFARDAKHINVIVVTLRITELGMVQEYKRIGRKGMQDRLAKVAELGWRARVASGGLTGAPYMELVDAGVKAVDLSEIPWKEQHERQLYIPGTLSQQVQLWTAVEALSANLAKADIAGLVAELKATGARLESVAKVTQEMMEKKLSPVLASVEKFTAHLDETLGPIKSTAERVEKLVKPVEERLPRILENIETTSKGLPDVLARIRGAAENAEKIAQAASKSLTEDLAPTLRDLNKTVASLQALTDKEITPAVASIKEASARVPETVAQVNALLRRITLSSSGSLDKLDKAMDDIQQIAGSLRQLTERASYYPAHLLFGEPPPAALEKRR